MTRRIVGLSLSFFLAVIGLATTLSAGDWTDRVDPWVIDTAARQGETEFLVVLDQQADLSEARGLSSKSAKGWYVFLTLSRLAERTQKPVLAELDRLGAPHRGYWVANMIWVRGDLSVVEAMARRDDVARVSANPSVELDMPLQESVAPPVVPFPDVEPNITHTGAPDVFWNAGIFGQGAVIAGADTGYDWDHPALKRAYRGFRGGSPDHNYNWHDSIHSGGGVCGANSPEPCDDNGHGTHTMGTMVGFDGGTNWIGMAPAARWIGCRNMDQNFGSPTTYSECFQWFIAPTNLAGQNPDPTKAPDVVNNSWSCPAVEGCVEPNILKTVVENVRAAGILVSVSAGNSGPSCSTVNTPAAIYDASFSVGATNNSDNIASFSSRGPVTVDGSNRLKPDISAPGVGIRSSVPGTGYTFLQGTSMAAPHVSGMTGLLVSAAPCWAGDVDQLEQHMTDSALGRTTTQTCGGIPGSTVPNNTYGYGALRSQLPAVSCPNQISLTAGTFVRNRAVQVTLQGANPNELVFFIISSGGPGLGLCPKILGGLCIDVREPLKLWGDVLSNGSGTAVLQREVVGHVGDIVYLQAVIPRGSESVSSNLVVRQIVAGGGD